MDPCKISTPGPITFKFIAGLCALDDDWDSIFQGNPDNRIGIEHINNWSCKAYGRIIGVNPVVVDCGILHVENVVKTHDERCIGEFIGFRIDRPEFETGIFE